MSLDVLDVMLNPLLLLLMCMCVCVFFLIDLSAFKH